MATGDAAALNRSAQVPTKTWLSKVLVATDRPSIEDSASLARKLILKLGSLRWERYRPKAKEQAAYGKVSFLAIAIAPA